MILIDTHFKKIFKWFRLYAEKNQIDRKRNHSDGPPPSVVTIKFGPLDLLFLNKTYARLILKAVRLGVEDLDWLAHHDKMIRAKENRILAKARGAEKSELEMCRRSQDRVNDERDRLSRENNDLRATVRSLNRMLAEQEDDKPTEQDDSP